MFEIARDQAKLLPNDLAKLLGVNRCTVSFWYNGRSQPHTLIRPRVDKLLDGVAAAVKAGDLPVPHGVKRRERGLYIQTSIVRHLRALQAAA